MQNKSHPLSPDTTQLKNWLDQNRCPPLIYLYGDEPFLTTSALTKIKACSGADKAASFEMTQFDGERDELRKIVETAQTVPMFAKRRLILVRKAEAIKSKNADFLADHIRHIQSQSSGSEPECVMVFISEKNTLSGIVFELLQKQGWAFSCAKLKRPQLLSFLNTTARKLHLDIHPEAAALMLDQAQGDMGCLSQMLEQLSLYLHCKESRSNASCEVGLELASLLFMRGSGPTSTLSSAFMEKDPSRFLTTLNEALLQKEEALMILGLLAYKNRQLLGLIEAVEHGGDVQSALREQRIFQSEANQYQSAAKRLGQEKTIHFHRCLTALNHQLKRGVISEETHLYYELSRWFLDDEKPLKKG